MKQSKTPLWRKSCLQKLSMFEIREMLCEISENGDMYGYEDTSVEGYYNEYKDQFDDLAGLAFRLDETFEEYDVAENWDDATVGLLGEIYRVMGWDEDELDYFHLLNADEEELAQMEAVKRLTKLTKMQLIWLFRRVLAGIVLFYDIKAAHDCLCSIVEELDDRAVLMSKKDDVINRLYEDLTGKSEEAFDTLVRNLPDRMWVE